MIDTQCVILEIVATKPRMWYQSSKITMQVRTVAVNNRQ